MLPAGGGHFPPSGAPLLQWKVTDGVGDESFLHVFVLFFKS